MKPTTQKLLLVALAVVSVGTTGLVLLKGALENAKHDPQHHLHDLNHPHHHGHDHAHHGHGASQGPAATTSDTPETFWPAPAFNLTNQDNQPVTLETYKGKAVIASFIFTRCFGPCPRISAEMEKLQTRLATHPRKDSIHLVSFSVDPAFDTPAVLTHYAQRFGADTTRWSFLTGDRAAMWQMVVSGYKLALEDTPDDQVSPISHSTKLVLIDPQGQVRGYYDALDANSRALMLKHLDHVLAQPASGEGTVK